jgi:hypothetical protein
MLPWLRGRGINFNSVRKRRRCWRNGRPLCKLRPGEQRRPGRHSSPDRDLRSNADGGRRLIGADYLLMPTHGMRSIRVPRNSWGSFFIYSRVPIVSGFRRSIHFTFGRGRRIPKARLLTGIPKFRVIPSPAKNSDLRRRTRMETGGAAVGRHRPSAARNQLGESRVGANPE